jgi:hypothetical protein
MDHCGEALIGLVGAQRNAFELFELAEKRILNPNNPSIASDQERLFLIP